jgi:hypothetical protein
MRADRVISGAAAGEQRMRAAGLGRPDVAGDANLAAFGIAQHFAARRGGRDLQAPAGTEQWRARGEDGAGEIDLARDRRAAVVEVQRRAGDENAVVGFQPRRAGQACAFVRGEADLADRVRGQLRQRLRIGLAGGHAESSAIGVAIVARVALDHQQMQTHAPPSCFARASLPPSRRL